MVTSPPWSLTLCHLTSMITYPHGHLLQWSLTLMVTVDYPSQLPSQGRNTMVASTMAMVIITVHLPSQSRPHLLTSAPSSCGACWSGCASREPLFSPGRGASHGA